MLIAICIALSVILAVVLSKYILLLIEIRKLDKTLESIANTDTNAQLTVVGSSMARFAKTINTILAKNREYNFQKANTENMLKATISNISHDLRTPLTSAKGYLQMLNTADETVKVEYLSIIDERLDTLSSQLNNLFEFARVLEGSVQVNMQVVDICAVVRGAMVSNHSQLVESGLSIELDIPSTSIRKNSDLQFLDNILQNLIQNACIHGKDFLRISVSENGIRVSNRTSEVLDPTLIFERFYTADASRSNKSTGLGLAIVKEQVQRIGSKVYAALDDDVLSVILEIT